jgi:hypothetical protein
MGLFDLVPDGADLGYLNLRAAKYPQEKPIKAELEQMWAAYEPYADTDFPKKFAISLNEHFWEMYLAVRLRGAGKTLRPRTDLTKKTKDFGPDICVLEEGRSVWIECVAPRKGKEGHEDSVPELSKKRMMSAAPRRQVELRITSSLLQKQGKFQGYRKAGIVAPDDIAIIAFSGSNFWAQSVTTDIPQAFSAVYPIGSEFAVVDKGTGDVVKTGYEHAPKIPRKGGPDIERTGFLSGDYADIAGIIWSRRTTGNLVGPNDLAYVHNVTATTPLAPKWGPWATEYLVHKTEDEYQVETLHESAA